MRRMAAKSAEDPDASGPAGDGGPGRASAPERRRFARPAAQAARLAGGVLSAKGQVFRYVTITGGIATIRDRGRGQPGRARRSISSGALDLVYGGTNAYSKIVGQVQGGRRACAAGRASRTASSSTAGQPNSLSGVGGTPLASVLMQNFDLDAGRDDQPDPGRDLGGPQLDRPEHEHPAPHPAAGPVVSHPAGERRQHRGRRRAGSSASSPPPAAATTTTSTSATRDSRRASLPSNTDTGPAASRPGRPEPHRDDHRHHDRPDRHRQLVADQLRLDGGIRRRSRPANRRRSPPRRASRSPTPATAAATRCSPASRAASPPSRTSSSRWPRARPRPSPPRRRASSSRPTPSAGRPATTSTR